MNPPAIPPENLPVNPDQTAIKAAITAWHADQQTRFNRTQIEEANLSINAILNPEKPYLGTLASNPALLPELCKLRLQHPNGFEQTRHEILEAVLESALARSDGPAALRLALRPVHINAQHYLFQCFAKHVARTWNNGRGIGNGIPRDQITFGLEFDLINAGFCDTQSGPIQAAMFLERHLEGQLLTESDGVIRLETLLLDLLLGQELMFRCNSGNELADALRLHLISRPWQTALELLIEKLSHPRYSNARLEQVIANLGCNPFDLVSLARIMAVSAANDSPSLVKLHRQLCALRRDGRSFIAQTAHECIGQIEARYIGGLRLEDEQTAPIASLQTIESRTGLTRPD